MVGCQEAQIKFGGACSCFRVLRETPLLTLREPLIKGTPERVVKPYSLTDVQPRVSSAKYELWISPHLRDQWKLLQS